jgi:hypothetical protein
MRATLAVTIHHPKDLSDLVRMLNAVNGAIPGQITVSCMDGNCYVYTNEDE